LKRVRSAAEAAHVSEISRSIVSAWLLMAEITSSPRPNCMWLHTAP
jgi:hypothetical protein